MYTLSLYGWGSGRHWTNRWMKIHGQRLSHVTLRVFNNRTQDWMLHCDTKKCIWIETGKLRRMYKDLFTLKEVIPIGTSDTFLPLITEPFSALDTIIWYYGARFFAPKWRPRTCLKACQDVAAWHGISLPDTNFIDKTFDLLRG